MSRLIVGPFNRVEGDLEVKLDIEDGHVKRSNVVAPLYRGFEKILNGKDPRDALVYAPRICGICSVAQSSAAAGALAALQKVDTPPNGQSSANIILATENIADHITHFYMFFMPDFTREIYAQASWYQDISTRFLAIKGPAASEVLPARAQFLHIIGILAGKWPHSLAIQPGGTTKAVASQEQFRLSAILLKFRKFLEQTLFGAELEEINEIATVCELQNWAAKKGPEHSDFCRFLFLSQSLKLSQLGSSENSFMSYGAYQFTNGHLFACGVYDQHGSHGLDLDLISEDVSHSWMAVDVKPRHPFDGVTIPQAEMADGYSWCKAPRLAGQPVEVGALSRQLVDGHPLIRDAIAATGSNVENRIIARLLEVALLVPEMQKWINNLQPGEPFRLHGKEQKEGKGVGLIEAARGSLGHWMSVRNASILNYQIIAPTTWNFSPRDQNDVPGPLEQALVGAPVKKGESDPVSVQHIVRSFDPCMVCTVH